MDKAKIGFIGSGNMAYALCSGISKNMINCEISVFDLDKSKYERFSKLGAVSCADMAELVSRCHYIFLSVKPQNFEAVLSEISATTYSGKVFISIAAGITTEYIKSFLQGVPVVRVMPNLPLLCGKGACAVTFDSVISESEKEVVSLILETGGVCVEIPESKMNAVVAVNGSSPAYFFYFAKAMTDFAVENGISYDDAIKLISQTMSGAAEMIKDGDLQKLIEMVCSPGGTTIEAMNVFKGNETDKIIFKAMTACADRSKELQK